MPPRRHVGRVLRPSRIHAICRSDRARGGHGGPPRVPSIARRAHSSARGHARPFFGRRLNGPFQRSATLPRPFDEGDAYGGRDARRRRKASLRPGAGLGSASRAGMPPSSRSASRADSTIPPLGTVVNLAARLCAEAKSGQILVDTKVQSAIVEHAEMDGPRELSLKGIARPVTAYDIRALRVDNGGAK